jgi:hypothetical protein
MKTLLFTLSAVVIAACGPSHRYAVNEPVEKKLGAFKTVEILPFSTNVVSEAANRVAEELPNELVTELQEATRNGSEDRLFSAVTRSTNETEDVLTIRGRILSFDEGSRAKRYFLGFGSGTAHATIECSFTAKSTGRQIAVATFEGELSGGLFGGSSDDATKGVIKAIEEFLKDNY